MISDRELVLLTRLPLQGTALTEFSHHVIIIAKVTVIYTMK